MDPQVQQIKDRINITEVVGQYVTLKRAGRYETTVVFPRAGQWSYAVRDGISTQPPVDHAVVIKDPAPVVNRPDPVGPRGLPIALAGLLALGAAGYAPPRRHRQRVTGPLHPA